MPLDPAPEDWLEDQRGVMAAMIQKLIRDHDIPESALEDIYAIMDFFYQEGFLDGQEWTEEQKP